MTRKAIIYDYLFSWFFFDCVATFPYSWVVEGCVTGFCDTSTNVFFHNNFI